MTPKTRTSPDVSLSSDSHVAAMKDIDSHLRSWAHNVKDDFKALSPDEIKLRLKETANPFAVCFENWIGDFNISTGMRNANAFNAKEAFYVGNKRWDKRGAVGVYNYTDINWIPTMDDFLKLKEKYIFIGIDNVLGSVPLAGFRWQPNTLLIFGEEGVGLTPETQALCEAVVEIEMYGSIRSLNCGTASGIIMHDFVSKMRV
jgi:tRNA G18 (ribose-2'-O)-methylase SpoU